MNWIYKNHELKTSGCYNMNFLFNNGKFYIMDNHLAAAWCWLQKIDTSKRYGLFHIDRHYDLLKVSSINSIYPLVSDSRTL